MAENNLPQFFFPKKVRVIKILFKIYRKKKAEK